MSKNPYSLPEIYEIAFSFRDYPKAADFIIETAKLAGIEQIDSMLELGCGPGQYCLEFAKRGVKSFGLDNCPEMVAYVNEKAKSDKVDCKGIESDFRKFKLDQPASVAVCMMATAEHLLTNRDMVAHLNSVADNLTDNGLYIMELSHPRDLLTDSSSTGNHWTMEKDDLKVTCHWGEQDRQDDNAKPIKTIDPLTEIVDIAVKYEIEKDSRSTVHEHTSVHCFETQTRPYTAGLIRALVELSGRFHIVNMYGDLSVDQPFDNSKESWRMILVLRKF